MPGSFDSFTDTGVVVAAVDSNLRFDYLRLLDVEQNRNFWHEQLILEVFEYRQIHRCCVSELLSTYIKFDFLILLRQKSAFTII